MKGKGEWKRQKKEERRCRERSGGWDSSLPSLRVE